MVRRTAGIAPGLAIVALAVAGLLAGCSGDYSAEPGQEYPDGPAGRQPQGSIFGEGGASVDALFNGSAIDDQMGDALPVNRFLWQAALDTLSFLPLASTDPFTGVIATDWSIAPQNPAERFKVTAYMLSPALEASSLKVAVYRQVRNEDGAWIPAAVDPETPRKLENAILTRARQIRIADLEGTTAAG